MEKINHFMIQTVSVQGFKCFQEKHIFEFGDMTFLKGANGLGKSSIADAIAFAFTGTNFFGERYLDKLHHPQCPELLVELKIVDEIGEIHNLVRVHKNSTSTISFDNYNIRQKDMDMIFGDGDLFLSLFNPLYFVETLGINGKALLERMLPFVSHEDVLTALSDTIRSQMENENILSPENYIKNRRAEIQEQQENLIYLQGQADLQDTEKNNAQEAIKQALEDISIIEERLNELESERNMEAQVQYNIQLANLSQQLNIQLSNQNQNNSTIDLIEKVDEIQIKLEMMKGQNYQSTFTEALAQKEARLHILYSEHATINELIKNIGVGYQCPTCFHAITDNDLHATINGLEKKLKQCIVEGTKVKKDYMGMKEQEDMESQEFQKENNAAIHILDETLAEMKRIAYQQKHGNLTPDQLHELDELKQKKHDLEIQRNLYQSVLDKPNIVEEINYTEQEIIRIKLLIHNALEYIGKKNELIFKDLRLNKASIVLYEVVKSTSEIKDIFKIAFDGKEYKRLSFSEQVRAGLEITELLKNLSGRHYPTFIDNSESICVIDNVRPASQLIFSRVEKNKPLTVSYRNTQLREVG